MMTTKKDTNRKKDLLSSNNLFKQFIVIKFNIITCRFREPMFFTYHPKLIERMVKETPKTIVGLSVLSVIFLLIYKAYIPNELLIIWIISQSTFIYLRYRNAKTLAAYIKKEDSKKIRLHVKVFFGLLMYSAFIWNMGALVGVMYAPQPYEFISLALIMGILTAGTMSLSSIFKAYVFYFFLMLVPQLIMIYQYQDPVHNAVLLLSIIYIPFILMLSRSINRNLINHIEDNEALGISVEKLHRLSITDGLTEVYNRRHFFETSESMIALSEREHKAVSLLMLDIDHFKTINDSYGHQVGDTVLIDLSKKIQKMTRHSDLFARIGGEEFAILLYNVSIKDARVVAQNICDTIAEYAFFDKKNQLIRVTVSIGVASIDNGVDTLDTLYHKTDLKLYEAKESGRNCVR